MLNPLQSVFHYLDHFKTIFKSLSYLIWNHFLTEQGRERWNSFSIWSAKIKLARNYAHLIFHCFIQTIFDVRVTILDELICARPVSAIGKLTTDSAFFFIIHMYLWMKEGDILLLFYGIYRMLHPSPKTLL